MRPLHLLAAIFTFSLVLNFTTQLPAEQEAAPINGEAIAEVYESSPPVKTTEVYDAIDVKEDRSGLPSKAQTTDTPTPETNTVLAPAARQPQGALSGRVVYVGAGHGWTANQDDSNSLSGSWTTQRGDWYEVVEDLGNIDQLTMFVNYAFNAGATVVPFRPIGFQSNEVVLDNDDAGVTWTGTWNNSTNAQYYGGASDPVHYRYADTSATESATARYTPNIPETGFYPVYCWTRDGSDRVDDQLYRIFHTGGTTEIRINHRMVGKGWIWLGTYYFNAGSSGYVEISNQSNDTVPTDPVVIADAIRFGNGMGDIDRGGGVSGKPREDEASRYWVQAGIGQGASSNIYDSSSTDGNDNVSAPPRMAAWMNRESEGTMTDRVYLGFHTNASAGALGLYNGNNYISSRTPNQFRWAELVGRELNDDMVALNSQLEVDWLEQGPNASDVTLDRSDIEFGEINNTYGINDEFDATIIEAGGHGDPNDALNLRNPKGRNWIARACYQAMVRYFNEFGGATLSFIPEPPTNLSAVSNGSGGVLLSWDAPVVDGIGGDAATGYVLYGSINGYGFGQPVTVSGGATTSYLVSGLTPGVTYYFRVAATNAGGESLPSDPAAARVKSSGASEILIVNGFDRLDKNMNPWETSSVGTYNRVKPRQSNSFDYVVQHASAAAAWGGYYDSCQNEAVINGDISLGDYATVIWILGEESTADETFSSTEQTAVTNFLSGNGNLFVTGAEIGWDLVAQGSAGDQSFYQNVLKASYDGDDGGSYVATGAGGSIFNGIVMNFSPGDGIYDADYPDRISGNGGSIKAGDYTGGGSGGSAIQYDSGGSAGKIVMMGFPFETINSSVVRNDVMAAVLNFFAPNTAVDGWYFY